MATSKGRSLFILGITAIVFSRTIFVFFDDPEGPNLLVVGVTAAVLYGASMAAYAFRASISDSQKFWLAIAIQIVTAVVLYVLGVTV